MTNTKLPELPSNEQVTAAFEAYWAEPHVDPNERIRRALIAAYPDITENAVNAARYRRLVENLSPGTLGDFDVSDASSWDAAIDATYGEACRATTPAEVGEDEPWGWAWQDGSDDGVLTLRQDYEQHRREYPRMTFKALYTRPAVPDGFVMVPVEPTEAMLEAARARIKEVTTIIEAGPAKGATLVREPHYNAYRAMLAAAPAPRSDA